MKDQGLSPFPSWSRLASLGAVLTLLGRILVFKCLWVSPLLTSAAESAMMHEGGWQGEAQKENHVEEF